MTPSLRPAVCGPVASPGSSMRARRLPMAGPACTTCGRESSKTSIHAFRPCGAEMFLARVAGIATAYPSNSRSKKNSDSRPNKKSKNSVSPSSTNDVANQFSATSPIGPHSPSVPAYGSTPPMRIGPSTTPMSNRCGGSFDSFGTKNFSMKATKSRPTAVAVAPHYRVMNSASPTCTATSLIRRSMCDSPSSIVMSTSWCGPQPPGHSSPMLPPPSAPTLTM
ncbi:unannotated protein [freshwater metagenome]|uniref:Unannotated protein n=1 Tax=freshwater metagenome TaxID=449393 RepID=A0A6J6G8K1_9ZZZZ